MGKIEAQIKDIFNRLEKLEGKKTIKKGDYIKINNILYKCYSEEKNLNKMKTYFVRLLTKEEVEGLDDEFHEISKWYWTMTSNIDEDGSYATVFFVGDSDNPDYLPYYYVSNKSGVRPVISLKSDIQILGEGTEANPYEIIG